MRAVALAILLLLPLLPAAAAGDPVYRVDVTLAPTDTATARETLRITYDATHYSKTWRRPIPDGATFVEARDASGALTATTSATDVTVTTKGSGTSYAFTIVFQKSLVVDAPFRQVGSNVAAAPDSLTSVGVSLPAGWRIAGWRSSDGAARDLATGTLSATGPMIGEFLLLPPGTIDPGADATVKGRDTRRAATADVKDTSATIATVTTYDTDEFARDWTVLIPDGASITRITTPILSPVPFNVTGNTASVRLPYPSGYHLGGRSFTVEMSIPGPETYGGGFRRINLSVPAGSDDAVFLNVTLSPTLTATGARVTGGKETSPLHYESRGPLTVQLGYMPPRPPGSTRVTVGPFVLQAEDARAAGALATAQKAVELLPAAAGFVGGDRIDRPFFVLYTPADVFQWEEGFYTPGMNTIAIRASDLDNATDGKAHVGPVATLIHETTHGLVDRALPNAPDLSFFDEGLARLAETAVEAAFANEVVHCTRNGSSESCVVRSSRPTSEKVRSYHQAQSTFAGTWAAGKVSDHERGFLYDYSGLVFNAFRTRAAPGELERVLLDLGNVTVPEDATEAFELVVRTLLQHAPGMTREQLLYPGRSVATLAAKPFHACMGDLASPANPFGPEHGGQRPASGCGDLDLRFGTGHSTPPPTATPAPTPTPPAATPTPTVTPTSTPPTTPPPTATPRPPPPTVEPTSSPPVATAQPPTAPPPTHPPPPTPSVPPILVPFPFAAAVAVVALTAAMWPRARRR